MLHDLWYCKVVKYLHAAGFEMGDGNPQSRGMIYRYNRKGVRIDILDGHTLRKTRQDGRAFTTRKALLKDARSIILSSFIDGDCPDARKPAGHLIPGDYD